MKSIFSCDFIYLLLLFKFLCMYFLFTYFALISKEQWHIKMILILWFKSLIFVTTIMLFLSKSCSPVQFQIVTFNTHTEFSAGIICFFVLFFALNTAQRRAVEDDLGSRNWFRISDTLYSSAFAHTLHGLSEKLLDSLY